MTAKKLPLSSSQGSPSEIDLHKLFSLLQLRKVEKALQMSSGWPAGLILPTPRLEHASNLHQDKRQTPAASLLMPSNAISKVGIHN